jgi:hypothetical protein
VHAADDVERLVSVERDHVVERRQLVGEDE